MAMGSYVKSKSKTGKTPRTGNRYQLKSFLVEGERCYAMVGQRIRKGQPQRDVQFYDSPADARADGWVLVS